MTRESYMTYAFHLANQAGKKTQFNPKVGAVLVYNNNIIGYGYHAYSGGPHAEVNCLKSVAKMNRHLIYQSTLYVTLEPCCHHGKTPPCTELIIKNNIKKVVISTIDPSDKVAGKGILILKEKGIDVITGVLENQGKRLISPFTTSSIKKRPYIILKTVKSKDNYIGKKGKQVWLSNDKTGMLTHKWRSEVDAILVGTNTVISDNPSLTCRYYPGENPVRIIIDKHHKIPLEYKIFNKEAKTYYFSNSSRQLPDTNTSIILDPQQPDIDQILYFCFNNGISKLLVEGGSQMIKSFYDLAFWDEARIITCPTLLESGIKAVNIDGQLFKKYRVESDHIVHIIPSGS